jgi:hypothetical protein
VDDVPGGVPGVPGATVEMVDCLDARAAHWQAEMEEAFSRALGLGLLSGDRADRLRAVQELWLWVST